MLGKPSSNYVDFYRCENKTKCSLQASDDVFGNTCQNGSTKYLFVKYQCKGN